MNEFADNQLTRTKIYIDKMNESTTMFPVTVTLNELPDKYWMVYCLYQSQSKTLFLDIMNFIETPYHFIERCVSHM